MLTLVCFKNLACNTDKSRIHNKNYGSFKNIATLPTLATAVPWKAVSLTPLISVQGIRQILLWILRIYWNAADYWPRCPTDFVEYLREFEAIFEKDLTLESGAQIGLFDDCPFKPQLRGCIRHFRIRKKYDSISNPVWLLQYLLLQ
jgi:hypothetical protein